MDYAGEISVLDAWKRLEEEPDAVLLDVRTLAEWQFVGLPDLSATGRQAVTIEWQQFPSGQPNPNFLAQVEAAGITPGKTVLCLCRSGARSLSAARLLTQAGYGPAYNITEGFEGNKDAQGHRGTLEGWKAAGLPWQQG